MSGPASGMQTWLSARRVAVVAALTWAVILASNLIRPIDFDSASYLGATALVLQGKVPYHDFYFIHPPVLLYAYAGFLKVAGLGWLQTESLSVLFGLLSVALLAAIATRAQDRIAATIVLVLGVFSYPASARLGHYYSVEPGVLWLLLAVWIDVRRRRPVGIALAAAALVAAASTRVSYAPAIIWYGAYLVMVERRRWMSLLVAAAGAAAAFGIIWGYVLAVDSRRTLFAVIWHVPTMFPQWGIQASVVRPFRGVLEDLVKYPLVNLPLAAIAVVEAPAVWRFLLSSVRGRCPNPFYLLVGGLYVALAAFSYTASPLYSTQYHLYYWPLGLLVVSVYAARHFWPHVRDGRLPKVVVAFVAMWIVAAPLAPGGLLDDIRALRDKRRPDLDGLVSAIRRHGREGARVLSFAPLFPLMAGRSLLPGSEDALDGFVPQWDAATAADFHLYNADTMFRWARCQEADLVVVTDKERQAFHTMMPSVGPRVWQQFETLVKANYDVAEVFVIDDGYWGNATLYVPRPPRAKCS